MNSPCFKRTGHAIFAEVGTDIVALNVERGLSYGMEAVTATVWQLLAEPRSLTQLCEKLVEIYEVDPETCRADVEALLAELESEGLIERSGEVS